jgi:hypothetical protein
VEQIKRYGQALSGGVTPFDEEVERHLAPGKHKIIISTGASLSSKTSAISHETTPSTA